MKVCSEDTEDTEANSQAFSHMNILNLYESRRWYWFEALENFKDMR